MLRLFPTPRRREKPVGKSKALIGKVFHRSFSDTRVSKNANRVGHAGRGMAKEKADV